MKLRTTFATVLAAAAGVMGMAAAPATTHSAVVKKTPTLSTAFSATTLGYGQTLHGTVHLGPTATNRTVTVYAKNWGNGATYVAATGKVNSAGNFTFAYWESQTRTWWASFGGDAADNAVTTAGVAVHVNSSASASLAGYYKTTTWHGQALRTFHKNANIYINGQVLPDNGTAQIDIQYYYNGQWTDGGRSSVKLAAGGRLAVNTGTDTSVGDVFRVIVINPGTTANGTGYSNWLYLSSTN